MYSRQVVMDRNRFEDNWGAAAYGLLLKEIRDSRITGNTISGNSVGLYLEGSSRNEVRGNAFVSNGWAVRLLADAEQNTFTRNQFTGNSFDVETNSRSNYSVFREIQDQYEITSRPGRLWDIPFRPVRLFSMLVQRYEPALILLRSFFVDLLDAAERVLPVLTPETLVDERPLMRAPT
jgi:nitrous oxidase accessory protein